MGAEDEKQQRKELADDAAEDLALNDNASEQIQGGTLKIGDIKGESLDDNKHKHW